MQNYYVEWNFEPQIVKITKDIPKIKKIKIQNCQDNKLCEFSRINAKITDSDEKIKNQRGNIISKIELTENLEDIHIFIYNEDGM